MSVRTGRSRARARLSGYRPSRAAPGAPSDLLPIRSSAIRGGRYEAIEPGGVVAEEGLPRGVRKSLRYGGAWGGEVPVRIVTGGHEVLGQPQAGELVICLDEPRRGLRLLHRLRGEPEVVGGVLRWLTLQPRRLDDLRVGRGVEAPGERRSPRPTGLDRDGSQARPAVEHAFEYQTGDGSERAQRVCRVVLEVIRRHAATRRVVHRGSAWVKGDRQTELRSHLE